jgi:hypothetical protein
LAEPTPVQTVSTPFMVAGVSWTASAWLASMTVESVDKAATAVIKKMRI